MNSSQRKPTLKIAKAVRILSIKEITFFLAQYMKFTTVMDPFPKFPIMHAK